MGQARHKVFVSFSHEDDDYKDKFERMMRGRIVGKAVHDGDIGDGLAIDTIRRKIREDFIADATVTVVLVGPCTWQRKHVDWEISSSLRHTEKNPRCGLLGILLPNHRNFGMRNYDPHLVPPRLADNCNGEGSYSSIHNWTDDPRRIQGWIDAAFARRNRVLPDNSRLQFGKNWTARHCSEGWTD